MSALEVLSDVLRSLFLSTTSWQPRETPEQYATRQAKQLLRRLSAMPLASRLALARALVLGWAVVPREPTEAMVVEGEKWACMTDAWTAMLAAAEKEPQP